LTLATNAAQTLTIIPPKVNEFRDAANRFTEAMVGVLARIQRWEIAFGGGHSKFARALTERLDHARDAAIKLLSLLETPGGGDASVLRGAIVEVHHVALELTGLLWDLRIESQNLLLGGLFQYRVPRRQPTGPGPGADVMTLS
jgi:hypothetical protein